MTATRSSTGTDVTGVLVLIVIGSAVWTYFDARDLNYDSAIMPALAVLLLWIVGFPMYLWDRRKYVRQKQLMAAAPATQWPPGWYSDPWQPGHQRWWDGHNWTVHQQ